VDPLLLEERPDLAKPELAFLGVLPGMQFTHVVEPEDDSVLVVPGSVAGAECL